MFRLLLLILILQVILLQNATVQAGEKAAAKPETPLKAYTEKLSGTDVSFEMVPIPGGVFRMGSPASEPGREKSEGPQFLVKIEPFWMGKHEVTWAEYDLYRFRLDIQNRKVNNLKPNALDKVADAVTRPTKEYTDMSFGSGKDGYPAICMTQLSAKMYCKWLTEKTGHYYRLPSEAEWEYACRAGTSTAYSFGNDPKKLGEYAWYYENAGDDPDDDREVRYHKVGRKKPNAWGLYDMHGNVSEWVLDQYQPDFYRQFSAPGPPVKSPLAVPTKLYPRVVRGGSWDDDAEQLRSASRMYSDPDWKIQDPQIPKSIWYHTDATFVGFRIVRPLKIPSEEEQKKLKLVPLESELSDD